MISILIRSRDIYGKTTWYPMCSDAKLVAAIAGTKTLTVDVLSKVRKLGIEIIIDNEPQVPAWELKTDRG
jgi:hypothetical protein